MGHANISNFVVMVQAQIYAHGKRSIREIVDRAMANGVKFQASEGPYEDEGMITLGVEVAMRRLAGDNRDGVKYVVPLIGTKEEQDAFDAWTKDDLYEDPRMAVLMGIRWKFAPNMRAAYVQKKISVSGYYEN